MTGLHLLIAQLAVALALLATVWSAALAVTRRPPGRLFLVNFLWVGLAIAVVALSGLFMLMLGHTPGDPLHLLYGALGTAAIPVAIAVGSQRPPRQQALAMLIASVVLLILLLRLFQTGP
jgi:hypothetical protein